MRARGTTRWTEEVDAIQCPGGAPCPPDVARRGLNVDAAAELMAIEAIKRLKARYFRLMDTQQWEAWGEVFTRDATLQASPDENERFEGRDAIVRSVRGHLTGATTVHHGHMPEIEITGDETATGIWAMFDFVDLPALVLHGWGHYHEEYAVEDGTWRIHRSRLTRLRLDITPKSQEDRGQPGGLA